MELQHFGRNAAQLPRDAGDLADAGEEAEHVPVALTQRPPHDGRDVVEQRRVDPGPVRGPDGARRRCPDHVHRVGHPVRLHHRCAAEEFGPGLGVGGGRGADQPQFGPQRRPYVQQEGERGVRVQVPFVALVEDDDIDARQLLVALQPLQQHAGGDHLDDRPGPGATLPAHRVADPASDGLAEQPGHPPGGGPYGEAARFGDQHPPHGPAVGEQPREGERHQRRLAGPGRGREDGGAVLLQCLVQGGQGGADGKFAPGGVHGGAQPRSVTKIAVPGISRPRSGDQPPHSCSRSDGHSGSTRSISRKPAATSSRTRSPRVRWCST